MLPGHWRLSASFKSLLCLIGWVSIVATTGVLDGRASWGALEMFTTQSNIACTLYFTVAAVRLWSGADRPEDGRPGRPFAPVVKGIVTMAVTVTFLVAWLVLRMGVTFESASSASLLGLHVVVPLMALVDCLLFDEPGHLRWRDAWVWLTAPLLYLLEFVVVLAAGGSLGEGGAGPGGAGHVSRAPYPFLDIDSLGVGQVALNVVALAAGVLLLGLAAVVVDRVRARRSGIHQGPVHEEVVQDHA